MSDKFAKLEDAYKTVYTEFYDNNPDHAETALFNLHANTETELKENIIDLVKFCTSKKMNITPEYLKELTELDDNTINEIFNTK